LSDDTDTDILIAGAGVLGVTIAFWLSSLYGCRVSVVDLAFPGAHTSSRNTGVIHRPFYLDPSKKRMFARASLHSRGLWESLAKGARLPWASVGTYNVALDERDARTVERYRAWGVENGMDEGETKLLSGREVASKEPEVSCISALLSKTDVSVDFGAFTRHLWGVLSSRGVRFILGSRVASVRASGAGVQAEVQAGGARSRIRCSLLVNAAGGGALGIAHSMGYARDLSVLHFRGEYWAVDEPFASKVSSNIYRPPRFPEYPFLDPHFVVRANGERQIGPNAVVVPGPYVYSGVGLSKLPSFLEGPVQPKARLFSNRDFVSLVIGEWRSSLSKRAMCDRVRRFVPRLGTSMLNRRAIFGVRSSVVDGKGFVPEALLFKGESSLHIVNFNSPGATGAPAFSAKVVDELRQGGYLQGFGPKELPQSIPGWDFEALAGLMR
jgi:(S)-2-hydroxyglutarate dehydrogenase